MLDLEPIKARLAAATPGPWTILSGENSNPESPEIVSACKEYAESEEPRGGCYVAQAWHPCDATLIAHAPADLAALVDEVERLQAAITRHRQRMVIDPQPWDRDLWAVLDA